MEPFLTRSIHIRVDLPPSSCAPTVLCQIFCHSSLKNIVSLLVSIVFSLCQNGGRSLRQRLDLYISYISAIQLVLKYVNTWLKKIVIFTSLHILTPLSQIGMKMGGRLC